MMLTECRRVHFSGMIAVLAVSLTANTQMTTSQYDNARTGTYLTVNPQQFGKIFTMKVDGDVYAQPLFLAGVEVPGKGATISSSLPRSMTASTHFEPYGNPAAPLWQVGFLDNRASTVSATDHARSNDPNAAGTRSWYSGSTAFRAVRSITAL
jgi:hypothetical protein